MSNSNEISSGGIVTFTVNVDGKTIQDELSVLSIHIEKKTIFINKK